MHPSKDICHNSHHPCHKSTKFTGIQIQYTFLAQVALLSAPTYPQPSHCVVPSLDLYGKILCCFLVSKPKRYLITLMASRKHGHGGKIAVPVSDTPVTTQTRVSETCLVLCPFNLHSRILTRCGHGNSAIDSDQRTYRLKFLPNYRNLELIFKNVSDDEISSLHQEQNHEDVLSETKDFFYSLFRWTAFTLYLQPSSRLQTQVSCQWQSPLTGR